MVEDPSKKWEKERKDRKKEGSCDRKTGGQNSGWTEQWMDRELYGRGLFKRGRGARRGDNWLQLGLPCQCLL